MYIRVNYKIFIVISLGKFDQSWELFFGLVTINKIVLCWNGLLWWSHNSHTSTHTTAVAKLISYNYCLLQTPCSSTIFNTNWVSRRTKPPGHTERAERISWMKSYEALLSLWFLFLNRRAMWLKYRIGKMRLSKHYNVMSI